MLRNMLLCNCVEALRLFKCRCCIFRCAHPRPRFSRSAPLPSNPPMTPALTARSAQWVYASDSDNKGDESVTATGVQRLIALGQIHRGNIFAEITINLTDGHRRHDRVCRIVTSSLTSTSPSGFLVSTLNPTRTNSPL